VKRRRLGSSLIIALTIAVGLVVLLGYFIDLPVLTAIREIFVRWAVILTSITLLVGVANLVSVHWRRMVGAQTGGFYSVILLLSFAISLVVFLIYGPTGFWSMWIFNSIQVPAESSLMALLAVVLAYAGARLLNRRINLFSLVFLLTSLVVLLGMATIPFVNAPLLADVRAWITQVPAVAGSRGILLGVALGTIATGLRILIGSDRPYGE
jgi:hypothetical protein